MLMKFNECDEMQNSVVSFQNCIHCKYSYPYFLISIYLLLTPYGLSASARYLYFFPLFFDKIKEREKPLMQESIKENDVSELMIIDSTFLVKQVCRESVKPDCYSMQNIILQAHLSASICECLNRHTHTNKCIDVDCSEQNHNQV